LIESILLGYPIPKLTIRQITDLATRKTTSEIVDGQQRTRAIVDFHNNQFAISRRSEVEDARGCRYDDLPDELKKQFLSFAVQADVFSGARDEEIIEMFRRINSHNVSLNKEEQRHAMYQGGMKWLVYSLAKNAGPMFERFEVFKVKQFARMADVKLIAEIVHALLNGITTTSAVKLDQLYAAYNSPPAEEGVFFPGSYEIEERFDAAWEALSRLDAIQGTSMVKAFNVYALLLALMHARSPIRTLHEVGVGGRGLCDWGEMGDRLVCLASIIDLPDDDKPSDPAMRRLWEAADKSTNTAEHRTVRFKAFLAAVSR
jgi:hypothetical protein